MDLDYYEVTSELDAREILRYLNHLGIRNITGEVLKYFITDLKKLIKYDLQQKENINNSGTRADVQGPERLHTASTFSSRSRSKAQDGVTLICNKDCPKSRRCLNVRNIHSAPSLPLRKVESDEKPTRRACSCVRADVALKKTDTLSQVKGVSSSSSKNLIKVPKQPVKKKCDPVSLYHYYTSLWAKYKSNVPGENNWSDLRWNVRQKMAGAEVKIPQLKVSESQPKKDGSSTRK